MKVKSLSRVQLLVTPWTTAHQAPLSTGSPGRNNGVGCHVLLQKKHLNIYQILIETQVEFAETYFESEVQADFTKMAFYFGR